MALMAAATERTRILRLALPAVVNNLSLTLMQAVDMSFVGGLGPEAIGAVGTVGTLIWAVMTLADGLSTGITAAVARRVGAADWEEARLAGRTGLVFTLGLSLLLAPLLISIQDLLLRGLGLPEALRFHAEAYLHASLWFLPAGFLRTALDAVHRAGGASVVPTAITVGINLVNAVLDPLLIFGLWGLPALGAAGAALSTGVSTALGALVQALVLSRVAWNPFRGWSVSRKWLGQIVDIGLPSTLELFTMAVSQNLIVAWAVNPLGSLPASAFQITMRLSSLSFTPAFGFGMAAIVLVGQALGMRDPDLARRLGWRTTAYAVGILALLSVVYWVFAPELASVFTGDPQVIALCVWPLRVYALTMAFLGATMVLAPALRGAGDARYTLWTMVGSRFGVRLLLAVVFSRLAGWGLVGVWLGMGADFVTRAILLGWRFQTLAWERLRS